MDFHERLKMLRKENDMTQAKLADKLSYGSTAIANYESGRNQPSFSDLKKIAAIFDVSLDYLLGMNEMRHPYSLPNTSPLFNDFHRYFNMLKDESKNELLLYMQWLISRQENNTTNPYEVPESYGSASLKVAQKPDPYKL